MSLRGRIGIGWKVTGLLFVMLLVAGSNVGAVYVVQQETNEATNTIDVASKQSVLSQRMAFLAFRKAEGTGSGQKLNQTIAQYERNLHALDDGTREDRTVANGTHVEPVPTAAREELTRQKRVWENYSVHIRTVATEDPLNEEYTASIEYVETNEEAIDDRTVAASEAYLAEANRSEVATELAIIQELRLHNEQIVTTVLRLSQSYVLTTKLENELGDHISEYDRLLGILENGGEYRGETVEPAPPAVQRQIEEIRVVWPEYKANARTVANEDRLNSEFWTSLHYVETHSDELNHASASLANEMTATTREKQRFLQTLLGVLLLVDIVVVGAGVVWTRRWIASPLERVTAKADQIAQQDIEVDLPTTERRDEIGQLYSSFRDMRDALESRIEEAESERARAQAAKEEIQEQKAIISVLNRILRHNLRNDLVLINGHLEFIEDSITGETTAETDPEANNRTDPETSAATDTTATGVTPETGTQTTAETATEPVPERDHIDTIKQVTSDLIHKADKARKIEDIVGDDTRLTEVDVVDVLSEEADSFEREHPAATISADLPDRTTVIAHDGLEFVVSEVLENAAQHHDSGTPAITISVSEPDEDGYVAIEIADDGPGISQYEIESLQMDYETAIRHASGLGLWLVNWLVSEMDGTLDFERREPTGTLVTVRLQAAENWK
jgi:signal transduction histidine kinase/uncharacterized protein YifE (UPF0438 family)